MEFTINNPFFEEDGVPVENSDDHLLSQKPPTKTDLGILNPSILDPPPSDTLTPTVINVLKGHHVINTDSQLFFITMGYKSFPYSGLVLRQQTLFPEFNGSLSYVASQFYSCRKPENSLQAIYTFKLDTPTPYCEVFLLESYNDQLYVTFSFINDRALPNITNKFRPHTFLRGRFVCIAFQDRLAYFMLSTQPTSFNVSSIVADFASLKQRYAVESTKLGFESAYEIPPSLLINFQYKFCNSGVCTNIPPKIYYKSPEPSAMMLIAHFFLNAIDQRRTPYNFLLGMHTPINSFVCHSTLHSTGNPSRSESYKFYKGYFVFNWMSDEDIQFYC